MKYTPEQRAQIAESFRLARNEIARGLQYYICHALRFRRDARPGDVPALRIIQRRMGVGNNGYVRSRTQGTLTGKAYALSEWLVDHHIVPRYPGSRAMRRYRLRWLDALIKEFSE